MYECMTDAGTTQDNFILPAPPVGGLPISQDWLDRIKFVYDRSVPIILPSGKSKTDLAAESAFSLPLMPTWLGTQHKIMFLLAIFKKTHFRIAIPIKGCSSFSFIYNRAWRHESESVKIINLDADAFFISSRALMIAQISAVKIDAESGNLMENGKTSTCHIIPIP